MVMEEEKVFVKEDNVAVIHCTNCSQVKRVNVGNYRDKKHDVRIKCPCSHNFSVLLDFRQQYRKGIQLKGRFMLINDRDTSWHKFTALNLSKYGIGIEAPFETLRKDEELLLEFTLDDTKQSQIRKKVIIRHVSGRTLGCQFTETVEFEREIGFYLLA